VALGPLPDVANVARVKLIGSNQGTPWVALFFWHYLAGTVTAGDLVSLCTGFATAFDTHLKAAFATTVQLQNVEAYDLSSRTGAVGSATGFTTGTRLGTALPTSTAAVASWKVNYRWRGGHPRTYWPAGVTADVENGHLWASAAASAFDSGNGAFLTAVNTQIVGGQGGYLTCIRYVHTPPGGTGPAYLNPPLDLRIQDVSVDRRLDTQRRRLGPDL
jgi:hypothetical protein